MARGELRLNDYLYGQALSSRELELLQLVAEGRSNPEIARILFVEITTVRTHTVRIFCKLGAPNRANAAAIAVQAGLVKVEVPDGVRP